MKIVCAYCPECGSFNMEEENGIARCLACGRNHVRGDVYGKD